MHLQIFCSEILICCKTDIYKYFGAYTNISQQIGMLRNVIFITNFKIQIGFFQNFVWRRIIMSLMFLKNISPTEFDVWEKSEKHHL
jgi:hypothetical protein